MGRLWSVTTDSSRPIIAVDDLQKPVRGGGQSAGNIFAPFFLRGLEMNTASGVFVVGRAADVIERRLAPAIRRLDAVERDLLLAGEQIEQGTLGAGEAFEVRQAGGINVDTTEATSFGLDVAEARVAVVEAGGAGAQAAAEAEVC